MARLTSPNGKSDVVLREGSAGATTSYRYDVFLVAKGIETSQDGLVATLHGASRNPNAYGVGLRWEREESIRMDYWQAQEVVISRPQMRLGDAMVSVSVFGGVRDDSAPAGSMLYNLKPNSSK